MQIVLITTLVLHVLSMAFWTGSTYTLSRMGGERAEQLFPAQMGAALLAVITGAILWGELHQGAFGLSEELLATGAVAAILAAGVQGAMIGGARRRLAGAAGAELAAIRGRMAVGQRVAAFLLSIALILMTAVRFL